MSLSESLRQLPEIEPPPGGWSDLARNLDGPRKRRRRSAWKPVLFAAAASAVITSSITVQIMKRPDAPAAAPSAATVASQKATLAATDPRLARLMTRSQELERVLAQVRPETNVWDASLQARTETIERGLSYVDLQLNYAQTNNQPDQALRLWENRVQLMTELVATHRNARLTAGAGPESSI
jgi:hypothetical protein